MITCVADTLMLTPITVISWIAGLMGATTHSQSDRIVTGRYSAFLIITQFIIFSLLGVLVQIGQSGSTVNLAVRKRANACFGRRHDSLRGN